MKIVCTLKNLDCINCATKIESRIKKMKNVIDANVNFSTLKAEIEYNDIHEEKNIMKEIKKIVKELEPDVKVTFDEETSEDDDSESKINIVLIIVALAFLIFAIFQKGGNIKTILYIASYTILSIDIIIKALKNIKNGIIFDENLLMLIATIGALLIGENFEAVLVMLLYKIGETLSDNAVSNSRKSISNLINLKANFATKIDNGIEIDVKPEELKVNDVIVIKPGEKVPVDSIVIDGSSEIDTSSLTGESMYQLVKEGDSILSGTINVNGLLIAKVVKEYSDSEVSKILKLLEDATNVKSKSEKFITKFSKFYTPIVIVLAALLVIIPATITKNMEYSYVYKALSFLVVSCPCALVISIPLTYFSAIGFASKRGILIKGASYLDKVCNAKNVLFDKTGTVTNGKFSVVSVVTNDIDEDKFMEYIKIAEDTSNHPIAMAIKEYASNANVEKYKVKNIKDIPGYGVELNINDNKVLLGNAKLMNDRKIEINKDTPSGTICYLAIDNKCSGYIVLNDCIKEKTKECITKLKEENVKNLIILTGDNESNARKVADELGIEEFSSLLPLDKVNIVKEYKDKGVTIFAGDGINDAPVIMNADIGIAMGGIGSDAAIEASDIVIMNDDIYKLVELFKISKFTRKIVIENIVFSILFKVMVLILITLGYSNMIFAIFADVGVTILTVLNSMRVFRLK